MMKTMLLALLLGVTALMAGAAPNATFNGKAGAMFDTSKPVTVSGTVKRVQMPDAAKDGTRRPPMVRCVIAANKTHTFIGLAPAAYLTQIGLALKEGDTVTVQGWQITVNDKDVVVARTLTLNGKTYAFRAEDGKPAWNPFSIAPAVQLTGAVQEVTTMQPPAQAGAAQTGKRGGMLVITLRVDQTTSKVALGPTPYLEQIKLTPKVGDTVTVNGWQMPGEIGIVARTLVIGTTTYTLRDADGKPAWAGQAGTKNGQFGGKRQPQ